MLQKSIFHKYFSCQTNVFDFLFTFQRFSLHQEFCKNTSIALTYLFLTSFNGYCTFVANLVLNHSARDTTREIDVNSISILCQYAENKILTGFHVVFTYFFDEILMGEKSTSFLQTFVEVILMSWKSSSFRRT